MKLLIIDTETTGLPKYKNSSIYKTDEWPYIIQLSWILWDIENNNFINHENDYIKINNNIIIEDGSFKTHGISRNYLNKYGIRLTESLNKLEKAMKECNLIVGHNISFDKRIIIVECIRRNIKFNWKNVFCTMKNSVELCQIEKKNSNNEIYYKYPTLNELHYYLFNTNPTNLHDAFVDIIICLRCYCKMLYDKDIFKNNNEIKNLFT
jgi:DNA polymerase III epsilon subunit-like protein